MKYRTTVVKDRKKQNPFTILFTWDEREFLDRVLYERGCGSGDLAPYIRETFFKKGWRRKLEIMRQEQGEIPLAGKRNVS